jgi:S-DNA-T family DNA segregation ATPase FtsK/SpoIIIE
VLVCLGLGAILAGRVFAIDWGQLMTLPGALRRMRPRELGDNAPFIRTKAKPAREARPAPVPLESPRKPTEIADPARPTCSTITTCRASIC